MGTTDQSVTSSGTAANQCWTSAEPVVRRSLITDHWEHSLHNCSQLFSALPLLLSVPMLLDSSAPVLLCSPLVRSRSPSLSWHWQTLADTVGHSHCHRDRSHSVHIPSTFLIDSNEITLNVLQTMTALESTTSANLCTESTPVSAQTRRHQWEETQERRVTQSDSQTVHRHRHHRHRSQALFLFLFLFLVGSVPMPLFATLRHSLHSVTYYHLCRYCPSICVCRVGTTLGLLWTDTRFSNRFYSETIFSDQKLIEYFQDILRPIKNWLQF